MVAVNRLTTPANMRWKLVDRATGAANAAIDWHFTAGDRVKIRLVNEMDSDHPMHHPFHLHGAGRFLVLARDGVAEPNLVWKDTVLVRTGQTVDILFDVTNPGLWMAHCHIAEHMQSGMMFSFTVARKERPDDRAQERDERDDRPTADDGLLDVAVIGGSQAGLAMAWHLARQHLRFVVLEAGPETGHTWRSRWDSLTLFTPAQYDSLPGMPFPGAARHLPDQGPGRRLPAGLRRRPCLPVRLNARVSDLQPDAEGFEVRTEDATSSAPARWWSRPGRSRSPSYHRPPSGWMRR